MPNVAINGKSSNANYVSAEDGGTQVIFVGTSGPPPRRRSVFTWLAGWTKLESMLALVCIFLAVVVIALIIILESQTHGRAEESTTRTSKADTSDLNGVDEYGTKSTNQKTSDGGVSLAKTSLPKSDQSGGGDQLGYSIPSWMSVDDICLTPVCVNAASRLLTSMDPNVAPCDNFFDFACGNWNRMNVIPADRPDYNTFTKLGDDIQAMLKNLLEHPVEHDADTESAIKAKNLYKSCLNETQIDLEGLAPIRKLLAGLGGWPILEGSSWKQSQESDVLDLIVKLSLYNNKILIDQWVSADDKKSNVNIIQLDQPDLGMPSADYFLQAEAASKLDVYRKYAYDVAVIFGADPDVARQDVRDMVNFEVELAKIIIPRDQRRDNEEMYNKMTVRQLSDRVPGFDWLRYLQKIFAHVNIDIDDSEELVVNAPTYFEKFVTLYRRADKRVVVNYLIWRIMMNRVINLPTQYRNIKNEYYKSMYGSNSDSARWFDCVTFVNENMGNALGRLFVVQYFDEGSKASALEMIHDIRDSFYELLDEADWMDEKTRVVAKEKAEAVMEQIGYADSILNDTALNAEYENIEFYADRYFDNVISNLVHTAITNLKKLREPVNRTKWSTTPAVVNAFYSSTKNQIMFPAAILQPPFYSKDYPKSLNYGGIGMVIGHEITHGFDDRGRQYDKDGILVQWWDDVVIKRFKQRAQCIIDQYSNYTLPEIDMKVNGVQTQGENIADNGGLKEAYRAYRKYMDHISYTEKRLPGLLEFSSDQLFFINFAQVWCGVMRPEQAVNILKTGVHSPGRFRVIGTLQNMDSFSQAFSCPADSYMNRREKCKVW